MTGDNPGVATIVVGHPWESESLKSLDDENELQGVKNQYKQYANETSIHGVKYTCESGRPLAER